MSLEARIKLMVGEDAEEINPEDVSNMSQSTRLWGLRMSQQFNIAWHERFSFNSPFYQHFFL